MPEMLPTTDFPYYPLPREYGWEILRSEVGSTLHGTGKPGHEDHDEMGLYVETKAAVMGLGGPEHWDFRTAEQREGRIDGRSPRFWFGDTDLICYSLRKWVKLAVGGNPSVLLLLHAPTDKLIVCAAEGQWLRDHADAFRSRRSADAFLGCMIAQRQRMTGERGKAGRVRSQPDGSVDWKCAMHMLRLGHQGLEYVNTGRITLPMPGETGERLRAVRNGEVPIDKVLDEATLLERALVLASERDDLPAYPDRSVIDGLVVDITESVWRQA